MKVYPLIYSRTKFCDYVSGFLVRPNNFDAIVATKYVSEALNEVKHTGGIRHAVFSVDEYIVYGGTACVTSSFITRILKEKQMERLDYDYQEFQMDKAGRPITFFIGFAVKKAEIHGDELPDIDLYETYKIYIEYLKKQWLCVSTKTEVLQENDYFEVNSIYYKADFTPDVYTRRGLSIVKNYNEDSYKSVINYYFNQFVKNPSIDSSFLSNILPDMTDEKLMFKNFSIYGDNIYELEKPYLDADIDTSVKIDGNNYESDNPIGQTTQIFNSTNDYKRTTLETSHKKEVPKSEKPMIFNSTDEWRGQRDAEGKKAIPTSMKIVIAIVIIVLVGILILMINQPHIKTQPTKVLQAEKKTRHMVNVTVMETMQKTPQDFQKLLDEQFENMKKNLNQTLQKSLNNQIENIKKDVMKNLQKFMNDQFENAEK